MSGTVYVLDTSAVIAGFVPGLADVRQVTVQEVLEEARGLRFKLELETAVTSGKVEIVEPSSSSLVVVEEKVKETGDKLSPTDVKLLALALDLSNAGEEPRLVTDDYAIQNLASLLGLSYEKVLMPGITEVLKWEMKCPACGRTYPPSASRCRVCGSNLIRKPRRKSRQLCKDSH
ncbi:MAG: DNA-binding protein [Hadesarchaea archaeon]|nr:DNA-binding protein [Hadesarchaea archaeon]